MRFFSDVLLLNKLLAINLFFKGFKMTWIDIIFIAIILLFGVIGLWKGLLDSILGLVTSIVSIFISIWGSKSVAKFIRKIVDIDGIFYKMLGGWFGDQETKLVFGVPLTREKLSAFLTVAFSTIIIFILIRLAVWLLSSLFDSATESSSALSGLNRVFGFAFGVAKGLVINFVLLAAVTVVSRTGIAPSLENTVEKSGISNFFYKYTSSYVEDKLSGGKIQSIIEDMKIDKREEAGTNTIKIDKDHWQLETLFYEADAEHTFEMEKYGSYILYYNNKSESTAVILTDAKIDIKFFDAEATEIEANPFTLAEGEDSKIVTVKITYNLSAEKSYSLTFTYELVRST